MPNVPNFEEIVVRCDGMLAPSIYKRLYDLALHSGGGHLVEVGTAHAAATVALALGLRDSGKPGIVVTFDRLTGGPRRHVVGPEERFQIIQQNLARFGVQDLVKLVVGDVSETASAVPEDAKISLLLLDADGRIDRDLLLFLDRVVSGGTIVIDDCFDTVRLMRKGLTTFGIDSKMRLTKLLVTYFQREGIISMGELVNRTYFGQKTCAPDYRLNPYEILAVYRQLVFMDAAHSPFDTVRRSAIQLLEAARPTWMQHLRVLRRRRFEILPGA